MATATTKTQKPPADAAAAFKVSAPQAGGYAVDSHAPRAFVPQISEAAYVTRGARVTRKGDEIPVLLVRDGSAARSLELSAVGAAISSGVITPAEIEALLAK